MNVRVAPDRELRWVLRSLDCTSIPAFTDGPDEARAVLAAHGTHTPSCQQRAAALTYADR
ncbi:hypothetical protein [Nocardia sp. NPDC051463]|uniref:hypothetical protein n=1 Tax=Nocardia sp. NPDC051463 TaxID=3154845 RepID=UPI00344E7E8D